MARMLQALKKLEARAAANSEPPAAVPASVTTVSSVPDAIASELVTSAAATAADPAREVTSHIDFAAAALANLTFSTADHFAPGAALCEPVYGIYSPAVGLPAGLECAEPELEPPTKSSGSLPKPSSPSQLDTGHRSTTFEKAALRVLTDPIRARPLVDLAERLDADSKQTGSRSILLAGVGSADDVHQTLLYTGILMTERQGGDVLLVDADWSSRVFSTALERDRQRGLGELIEESASIAEVCYPTGAARLFFLPAGQRQTLDLSAAGSRLEAALKKLCGRFSLVLIDGGHSAELGCCALARQVDATYLVVRLGAVEAAAAQTALRDFRASGARVLGCIAT